MKKSEQDEGITLSDVFKCISCGACCQGQTTVSLDEHDQQRLKSYFRLDETKLRERYLRVSGAEIQMQIRESHCVFYLEKSGCTVHKAKPWRCRQWPLHPSILLDKSNFEAIRDSCPGISKKIGYEDFCKVLRQLLQDDELLACGG